MKTSAVKDLETIDLMNDPQLAQSKEEKYLLRLYITDGTPQSLAALHNLRELCEEYLAGRYEIEVIDLLKNPERAQNDQIVAVPTLVRELPTPIRKFIGSLSNTQRILVDFDLRPNKPDPDAA